MATHTPISTDIEKFGNFDRIKHLKLDYTDVSVSKWRSRETGLTLLHLDYQAPIVKGYFVVASEIFDDTGRPHTLEHLVFMGSEKYPYKGVLDHLANRAFSSGTNAWTDQDHTAYTLATAGGQGFLQMLPIYVDHILYPTLRPSSFVTEVHHIDSEGQNSGVVYSEMQGRQSTSADIMSLKMQQLRYPPGSGYRSETAGLMEALRVLDMKSIQSYHGTYYVPHNLILIVAGSIATDSILQSLQTEIEPSIISHGHGRGIKPAGWNRPFLETPTRDRSPLQTTVKETVLFPEHDESMGEINIGLSGPPPSDFLTLEAIDILATYLTSSPTAPLNREFVEIASPLCTYIYFDIQARAVSCDVSIYAGSVPAEHLQTLDTKIRDALRGIASNGIDMQRMSMVLKRERRKFFNLLESSKGDAFSDAMIEDFLYGNQDGSNLTESLNVINRYQELESWSNDQWVSVLKRYLIDNPMVVVVGNPSASFAEKLAGEEKARIAAQIETLGEDGLAKATRLLADAKAEHDIPVPLDVISGFKVPDVSSISWIPVHTFRDGVQVASSLQDEKLEGKDISKFLADGRASAFPIQFDQVESDFVTLHLLFTLNNLPEHLLPYLSLYQAAFFQLPVDRLSGAALTHEEVVDQLDTDTVSYTTGLGFDGSVPNMMRFSLKVETGSYGQGVAWLRDLLLGGRFVPERLEIAVAKMLQSMPELKRDADTVMESIVIDLLHSASSAVKENSLYKQLDFLPFLAEQLKSSPSETVSALEELRSFFCNHGSVRVSVAGNVFGIEEPSSSWSKIFKLQPQILDAIPLESDTLNDLGTNPAKKAVLATLPSIESSFATHIAKGPKGFNHPEWPAVRVAQELLNALESYLWRYIRGAGLAYGSMIRADLESGLVSFSIHRSPNSLKAYQEARKVLHGLADESIPLDLTLVEAAKSSLVYSVAKQVSTPGRAALNSYINQALKGVPHDHHQQLLKKFQAVQPADVLAAMKKHFLPLFDSATSVAVVVGGPSKEEELVNALKGEGFEVQQRTFEVEEGDGGSSEGESSSSAMSS